MEHPVAEHHPQPYVARKKARPPGGDLAASFD